MRVPSNYNNWRYNISMRKLPTKQPWENPQYVPEESLPPKIDN